jgi:hypothetical protein
VFKQPISPLKASTNKQRQQRNVDGQTAPTTAKNLISVFMQLF